MVLTRSKTRAPTNGNQLSIKNTSPKRPVTKRPTANRTTANSTTTNRTNTYSITKKKTTTAPRRRYSLRTPQRYFLYRSLSHSLRLATVAPPKTLTLSPLPSPEPPTRLLSLHQVNDYIFSPRLFAHAPFPATFPRNSTWPPQTPLDIMLALGADAGDCVGARCYTRTRCRNPTCTHTFAAWRESSGRNWEDFFELRETSDKRGVGVWTKRSFVKGTVLGWYAGAVVPFNEPAVMTSDYLMDFAVGDIGGYILNQVFSTADSSSSTTSSSDDESKDEEYPQDTVWVDSSRRGNWTRFINHSCDAHCDFENMRVGTTRIMAIVLNRDVPKGVELTIDYGPDYWNVRRGCRCGAEGCVRDGTGRMG